MRLALIADIHGNKLALDHVLDQLDQQAIDAIVCLGDIAVLGPNPAGVVRTLRERRIPGLMGNTDAWLFQPPHAEAVYADLTAWSREQLAADDLAYLRNLPETLTLPITDEITLLAFHGSPRSWNEVIAATTPDEELDAMLSGHPFSIAAGGHTHVQLLRRIGQRHLLNPGSIGLPGTGPGTPNLPENRHVAWAEYAVVDITDHSNLTTTFHRSPLNMQALLDQPGQTGMPHLGWWRSLWLEQE